jgi:DNA invertase Pin-like site-specific DNA recombinase
LASLEGWRDESERKKTATRVRDAAKTRFERGYVVGGRVYGYKNERLPGVKGAARLKVAGEQAEIVRRIFRMAADGLGHSRIARQLNAEGIPGPSASATSRSSGCARKASRCRSTTGPPAACARSCSATCTAAWSRSARSGGPARRPG